MLKIALTALVTLASFTYIHAAAPSTIVAHEHEGIVHSVIRGDVAKMLFNVMTEVTVTEGRRTNTTIYSRDSKILKCYEVRPASGASQFTCEFVTNAKGEIVSED